MKGDFSRETFKPDKHYSAVRMQQGRVQLDTDFNEQVDIQAYLSRATHRDIIGFCGGPQGFDSDGKPCAGFEIQGGKVPVITKGRYYVDGILCENDAAVSIVTQPDLPVDAISDVVWSSPSPVQTGFYLAYLDVWQRHITALEDGTIREVALGGPDTTTRLKTVWQAKLLYAGKPGDGTPGCAVEPPGWKKITSPGSGKLRAKVESEATETDPCLVPAQAGYRGLENQLYRVEVHRVLSNTRITVKWSRENGSVVTRWESQDNLDTNKLTVSSVGRDNVLGFAPDDWIELTDDGHELRGESGLLVQIKKVDGKVLTIDPGSYTVDINDFKQTRKVRRWDMPGDTGEITVELNQPDNWIELEKGIFISLGIGKYCAGDYWLIPARTATGDIEWQHTGKVPEFQLPRGIRHHYCRLAILYYDGAAWKQIHDCRRLFPPLIEIIRFFHISGDGQESMPTDSGLPRKLEVGVLNGQMPVPGAHVRFHITDNPPSGKLTGGGYSDTDIIIESDGSGICQCQWQLGSSPDSQQVEAVLLEIDGKSMLHSDGTPFLPPIRFNANLSVARNVHYDSGKCINPACPDTVQEALDQLCLNAALYYVSGDGQETMPISPDLLKPLIVRVANGQWAVKDVPVVFTVKPSNGILKADGDSGTTITIKTDGNGLAVCRWQLDKKNEKQQVEAYIKEKKNQSIIFNANLSVASEVAYDPKNCARLSTARPVTVQQAIDELCKTLFDNPGILIRKIVTVSGQPLLNDGEITVDEFAEGIRVACDRRIADDSISQPTCFVKLDIPFPLNAADMQNWGFRLIGFQPLVLDGQVTSKDNETETNTITWRPTMQSDQFIGWLKILLELMLKYKYGDRVLAHLILKGNFIWTVDEPRLYLDGEVMGDPTHTSDNNLLLPGGDKLRGGDFEMWFWLKASSRPVLTVINVNTAPIEELETLPGIGGALAKLIVDKRPYETTEDLLKVEGIGSNKLEDLKDRITFNR